MPYLNDFENTSMVFNPTFNQLSTLPTLSYNCINKLMSSNELIWKLLKYKEPDAWKKPNLTKSEKMSMIYNGQGTQSDFHVFMDDGQIDVFNQQTTLLRIFPSEIFPIDRVMSDVYVAFQVLSYYDINHLTNYQTRVDTIIAEIVKTFNGVSINGAGQLTFDRTSFPRCKIGNYSLKPFVGKIIVLGFNYANDGTESV